MRYFNKQYHSPGTAPGTLTDHPGMDVVPPHVGIIRYNGENLSQYSTDDLAGLPEVDETDDRFWISVEAGVNAELLKALQDRYELHALALEDALNAGQHAKMDSYDNHLFIVASLPRIRDGKIDVRQVSLFLGENFLISLHEEGGFLFEPIVKRLQARNSQIRRQTIGFLAYALLDRIIDEGFPVLEQVGEWVEQLEDELLGNPKKATLEGIHHARRELLVLRRALWPQREIINKILQDDESLIPESVHPYLRDCYDHSIQVMELLEVYREMMAGMLDVYISSISYRLNDVMKVLTVIATLFIPPTFIVGVYGMNFDRHAGPLSMPELGWPYGYLVVWGVIVVIIISLLVYFRRKHWI